MKIRYFIIISLFFSISLFSTNLNNNKMPAIVSVNWLKKNFEDPNLRIIDLRREDEFLKGHIRFAVNIPGLASLFDENFMMPRLNYLKELISDAGINSDTMVVAYDNGDFVWAARFYWILQALGHDKVSILKYSYGKKVEEELPISTVIFKPKRKEFVPRIANEKIETKLSTYLSIGEKTIIDGRQNAHYIGKKSNAIRYGHIPTAKNYECTQNYQVTDDGNKMKDINQLKKIYKDIPKDKEVVLYCDGGAEAALNFIVLQELGYKASVYDGSWFEWGNDLEVPIENPSLK